MAYLKTRGIFKKYFEIFLTNFKISIKSLLEYKPTFYALILGEISDLFFVLATATISIQNFSLLIDWSYIDFLLLYLIGTFLNNVAGVTFFGRSLAEYIVTGKLNILLTKPVNPFFNYIFSHSFNTVIINLIYIPFIIYFMFKTNITFLSLIIFFLLIFLFFIQYLIFYHFIDSFGFKFKKSINNIRSKLVFTDINFKYLPAPLFSNFFLHKIFIFFPLFSIGYFLIPLFDNNYLNIINSIHIFFLINLVLLIILIFNWKIGLKKYEAFG